MKNFILLLSLMVFTIISIVFSALSVSPINNSQLFTFDNRNINVSQVFQGLSTNQAENLTLSNTGLCDEYAFFLTGYRGISHTNGHPSENFTRPAYDITLDDLYKQESPLITLSNGSVTIPTTNLTVFPDEHKNQTLEDNTFQVIVSFAFAFSFDAVTFITTFYSSFYHTKKGFISDNSTFMGVLTGFKCFILLTFLISGLVNLRDSLEHLLIGTGITIKDGARIYAFSGIVCFVSLIQLSLVVGLILTNKEDDEEEAKDQKKLKNSVDNVPKFTDAKQQRVIVKHKEVDSKV